MRFHCRLEAEDRAFPCGPQALATKGRAATAELTAAAAEAATRAAQCEAAEARLAEALSSAADQGRQREQLEERLRGAEQQSAADLGKAAEAERALWAEQASRHEVEERLNQRWAGKTLPLPCV